MSSKLAALVAVVVLICGTILKLADKDGIVSLIMVAVVMFYFGKYGKDLMRKTP